MGVYIGQSYQIVHLKYRQFVVCQLDLNKAIKKTLLDPKYLFPLSDSHHFVLFLISDFINQTVILFHQIL